MSSSFGKHPVHNLPSRKTWKKSNVLVNGSLVRTSQSSRFKALYEKRNEQFLSLSTLYIQQQKFNRNAMFK